MYWKNCATLGPVLFFVLFFTNQSLQAQALSCNIKGDILIDIPHRYAYLYISNTKSIISSPIINRKFQFKVNREKNFETGLLFLYKDSLDSATAINLIQKGIENSRLIAMEDLEVTIETSVKEAVVKGDKYNQDISDMLVEQKKSNYKEFFESHPDSPVSLIYLRILYSIAQKNYILRSIIKCRESFHMLSDKLKNSEEGKKLWKEIDTI